MLSSITQPTGLPSGDTAATSGPAELEEPADPSHSRGTRTARCSVPWGWCSATSALARSTHCKTTRSLPDTDLWNFPRCQASSVKRQGRGLRLRSSKRPTFSAERTSWRPTRATCRPGVRNCLPLWLATLPTCRTTLGGLPSRWSKLAAMRLVLPELPELQELSVYPAVGAGSVVAKPDCQGWMPAGVLFHQAWRK
jgi:hypothetical protein